MIDFEPTEEQALIIETVHQFAENEIRPKARECDEARALDANVLAGAHELGLVANGLPEAHGGGGEPSAITACLIAEELAWGDLSTAIAILSPGLLGVPVAALGTAAQQAEIIPTLTGGAFVPGALAVTEPRFDSDPFRPQTTAKRDGDRIVLDGQKAQVPWLDGGRHVLVLASEDGALGAYVVPRDADGLATEREQNVGLRGLPTALLSLKSVRVPASAKLEGDVRQIIHRGRVALAAMAVGMSRAAFELSRDYAKERETFGAPIATRQSIAFKLADMAIEIDAARLLTWEAANDIDAGVDAGRKSTLAYNQARQVALKAADDAVQIFGGHGFIRDYLPELFLRNAVGFTSSFEALALV